jgi:hypothetical protein
MARRDVTKGWLYHCSRGKGACGSTFTWLQKAIKALSLQLKIFLYVTLLHWLYIKNTHKNGLVVFACTLLDFHCTRSEYIWTSGLWSIFCSFSFLYICIWNKTEDYALGASNCYYTQCHQITSFKVTAKSYNVVTQTAELRRVEHFVGLLTPTCCNIFIFNRINEVFWLLHSSFLS